MIEENLPVLTVVVPLLTALVTPFIGKLGKNAAWATITAALLFSAYGALTLLAKVAGGEVVVYELGGFASPAGIIYKIDRLNAIILSVVGVSGALTALWMRKSIIKEIPEKAHTSFYTIFLLFAAGLMGMSITGDVFNLYVFIEIASITSYVLIAMGRTRESLFASYSYLVIGSVGATFILLGIGHLYMATGTLSMEQLAIDVPKLHNSSVIRTSFAYFTVGLAIKMALFPLHGWQPAAYSRAPSAVSLFMAATATKVSAYSFYRLTFDIFGTKFLIDVLPVIRDGIEVMAASAIIIGPLFAIRQTDLKRTFAFSSVGQIGYIMLGVVLLNENGVMGGLLHFWNHAVAKGCLFAAAGCVVYLTGASRIQDLAGLGKRAPWTATAITVGGCSMVGVPLTAGFISKFYLATGAIESGRVLLACVLLISSLLTSVYMWKILQQIWFTKEEGDSRIHGTVPWSMRLTTMALAITCLVLGIYNDFPVSVAKQAAAALLR